MIELTNNRLMPNYVLATNQAYKTLIDNREFSFPICIFQVLRKMEGVKLHTYSEAAQHFGLSFNEYKSFASSDYGFSSRYFKLNHFEVFYNDHKDEEVQRFTLAHELGHIVLGHLHDSYAENREANCFARNYLCPIPAIIEMNLQTIQDYCNTFYVSECMADIALNYKKIDYQNITPSNYNNFNDGVICEMNGLTLYDLYGYYG